MQGVVLAGGLGTRLRPITEQIPKCMAPVGDKPFLFHLLRLLQDRGVTDIVLCIGYLGEQVSQYFGDGLDFGMKIRYSQEVDGLRGTGGALKLAREMLAERFLVINGDTFLDVDYRAVCQAFADSHKKALIVASTVGPGERSDLAIDANLIVTRYDRDTTQSLGHVNAGVIALRREVVDLIRPGQPVSLEREVLPGLVAQREMAAYVTDRRFHDIGTIDTLKFFETHLRQANP